MQAHICICKPTLRKLGGWGGACTEMCFQKKLTRHTNEWSYQKQGRYLFFSPSKEKVKTEQSVQGYIRTCRKQGMMSFLPMFQGNRLHPRSHSILYSLCSSSSLRYMKAVCRDQEGCKIPNFSFHNFNDAMILVIHLN